MRTKNDIFSAWSFVGATVEAETRNEPPESIASSEIIAVVVVAICPDALGESVKNEDCRELASRFAMLYQRRPDLVVRLLTVIRERWTDTSVAAKVQRHILTQILTDGVFTNEATAPAILSTVKPQGTLQDVQAAKKARQRDRVKLPSFAPEITRELMDALLELRRRGFDVGLGS